MIDQETKNYVDGAISKAQTKALYSTKNASAHIHNGIDAPILPLSSTVAGISNIVAGANVTISPAAGTGVVTINASEPTIATTGNSANVVYTNNSGHAQLHLLSIALSGGISGGGSGTANFLVSSSVVQETAITVGSGLLVQHTVMLVGFVPAGATYEVTTATTGGGTCIIGWWQIVTF